MPTDPIDQLYKQWRAAYQLSAAILTIAQPTWQATLHRQADTEALFCLVHSDAGLDLSWVAEGVGWIAHDQERCIFGRVPPTTAIIQVIPQDALRHEIVRADDLFVAVATLPAALTVTFRDQAGDSGTVHDLPAWQPPPPAHRSRLATILGWRPWAWRSLPTIGHAVIDLPHRDRHA